MRLVLVADTHDFTVPVPSGDVLIHAGDLTMWGTEERIRAALSWLSSLRHPHKLFVAGNHDFFFDERSPSMFRGVHLERTTSISQMLIDFPNLTYLQDSGCLIEGICFWGTPWQPRFDDWAFNLQRGPDIARKWRLIPTETSVLITHGPPAKVLDSVPRVGAMGCVDLANEIHTRLANLRLHVFGHIHEGYGRVLDSHLGGEHDAINASICTRTYEPTNAPIVVDL